MKIFTPILGAQRLAVLTLALPRSHRVNQGMASLKVRTHTVASSTFEDFLVAFWMFKTLLWWSKTKVNSSLSLSLSLHRRLWEISICADGEQTLKLGRLHVPNFMNRLILIYKKKVKQALNKRELFMNFATGTRQCHAWSHAFWFSPIVSRSVRIALSKSEPFTSVFIPCCCRRNLLPPYQMIIALLLGKPR